VAAAILLTTLSGTAVAKHAGPGVLTTQPSMLSASATDASIVTPVITTGETIDGYRFEALPDGISLRDAGKGEVEAFVNHETSTVPFPYTATNPTTANSQNDFDNAQLSRLVLSTENGGVIEAGMVIESSDGYQRFCSNFLGTKENGFNKDLVFTNEEAVDWVNRTGPSWPAIEGASNARQSGVVVAYDPKTGEQQPIWGMGRFNHENSLAVPGYGQPVLLSGDDTFVNNPSQSQLFAYVAKNSKAVWNDDGDLWAFVSDDAARQRYEDFAPGDTTAITGHFIQVPKLIATGRNADGSDLMGADVPASLGGPYPVPTDGSFSRPPGVTSGPSVDGPQWVLERWSQLNHVFRFVRLEDMAYDKRPGMSNVIYVVDSGRGTAPSTGPAFGPGISTNGRVWKMVLDASDPSKVTSLSILIEGDDAAVKTPEKIHQPDNIESTAVGLYITEDPGSSQQFAFGSTDTRATTARIWQYQLVGGAMQPVFAIDQSADEGPTDVDPATTRGNLGSWESSGIIDASAWFGPGTFLVTVQAHSLFVEVGDGPDLLAPAGADWLNKREGGQLLLIKVAGG
jgi:hypothetical protein